MLCRNLHRSWDHSWSTDEWWRWTWYIRDVYFLHYSPLFDIPSLINHSVLGWQAPFAIVAAPNIILSAVIYLCVVEPKRGSAEKLKFPEELSVQTETSAKISFEGFKNIFNISSNRITFMQAFPGTVPWGFINIFLNDFITTTKGFGTAKGNIKKKIFLRFQFD
jgi:hypothetical protein